METTTGTTRTPTTPITITTPTAETKPQITRRAHELTRLQGTNRMRTLG